MFFKQLPSKPTFLTRALRAGIAGLGAIAAMAATSAGCLDRPVAPATPNTSNVFIDQITQTGVDKIDLVFGIDNSLSMADKQEILGLAVPELVRRLVTPIIDPATGQPEFKAIDNIHIGIVTSSIGGHGADQCSQEEGSTWNPTKNDGGHMLGSVRQGLTNHGPGFLAWNPAGKNAAGWGDTVDTALIQNVTAHVRAAGETGCGFEAQLESWYRFLIDPEPPGAVIRDPNNANFVIVQGVDQAVIDQRAAFLRPDSLVAVIMLTDENDCSTIDGGIYWLPGQSLFPGSSQEFRLPRSTGACLNDPNHACCRSCGLDESGGPPAGCGALNTDPECAKGSWDRLNDSLNLRCFDQKRRFGVDFLYPIERYVDGLTKVTIANRAGELVSNPLYSDLQAGTAIARDVSLVFLAGIIGVPWQDLATADTLGDPNRLTYLTAAEMRLQGTWDVILGAWPDGRPTDGLMWESVEDRTKLGGPTPTNPAINAPLQPSNAAPNANVINGHEYDSPERTDLQYACIFPLTTQKQCGPPNPPPGCDCTDASNKPLCNGTTQTHAKAYPGLRELRVLEGMGRGEVDNAIVASICPKITDQSNPDFGYNPAVAAIIDRLKEALQGRCLPRALAVDQATGIVPCAVVEATFSPDGACAPCASSRGRDELVGDKTALVSPVRTQLQRTGNCGGKTGKPCQDFCLCEILPAGGQITDQTTGGVEITDQAALNTCQTNPLTSTFVGYCYVDEAQQIPADAAARQAILEKCPATQKRILRFSDGTPAKGSIAFIACLGSPVTDIPPAP